jgi:Icc-related predicted phosphoesterase
LERVVRGVASPRLLGLVDRLGSGVSSSAAGTVRILLASDLHYSLRQLDWIVDAAPDFDLVVLAGDHLDISSTVILDAQIAVMLQYFRLLKSKAQLAVSSGNHDLTGTDANGERAALWLQEVRSSGIPTDGESVQIGDTLITICPWWDGPLGRASVAAQLERDAARRPSRWVWVYHWPPLGSPTCWTGRRHYGDEVLGGWIGEHRPDAVLTGHVHDPPFKPEGAWADRIGHTWVFNPGRQIGATPTRIELDLDAGSTRWVSLIGTEEIMLADLVAPPRSVF